MSIHSEGSASLMPAASLSRAPRSPRPRVLATLCTCTCAPAATSIVAVPIALPYLTIGSPHRIALSATLCPRGIGSTMTSSAPLACTASPTPSGSSAVATLSRSLMTMTGSIYAPIVLHLGSALQAGRVGQVGRAGRVGRVGGLGLVGSAGRVGQAGRLGWPDQVGAGFRNGV